MFFLSIKLTIKNEGNSTEIAVKKENRVLALFYVVAIQFRDLLISTRNNQISPLSEAKIKQFFTKQKIRLLLTAKL